MTIEADIVEVLRSSQSAHRAIAAELVKARAENQALERKIADLEASILALEGRADNLVDPSVVQPLLAELARVMAEGYGVLSPRSETERPPVTALAETSPAANPNRNRSSARGWT